MRLPRMSLRRSMVLIALIAVCLSIGCYFARNPPLDPLLSIILGHETIYSDGFNEEGFRGVRVGMTQGEVVRLIGQPLGRNSVIEPGRVVWFFSKPVSGTSNYWDRHVVFAGDLVTEAKGRFYIDD
jgi:hypothetical protein